MESVNDKCAYSGSWRYAVIASRFDARESSVTSLRSMVLRCSRSKKQSAESRARQPSPPEHRTLRDSCQGTPCLPDANLSHAPIRRNYRSASASSSIVICGTAESFNFWGRATARHRGGVHRLALHRRFILRLPFAPCGKSTTLATGQSPGRQ